MLRTNKLTKTTTLTFADDALYGYANKSFELVSVPENKITKKKWNTTVPEDETSEDLVPEDLVPEDETEAESEVPAIRDWLYGGYTRPLDVSGEKVYIIEKDQYDSEFLNRSFTETNKDYSLQKIIQKLNIHLNEFNYKFENTEDIGIPYLNKPTKAELDLFIRDAILTTSGVIELKRFASRLANVRDDNDKYGKNRQTYFLEFEVIVEGGETLWQSIEI